MEKTIQHFSDKEHELFRWIQLSSIRYYCRMCNLPVRSYSYWCPKCWFFIHEECATFPQKIVNHPLHTQHNLTLTMQSKTPVTPCHYCDKSFQKYDYNYSCDESCAFHMHMKCANIPLPTIRDTNEGEDSQLKFLCHGSSMESVEINDVKGDKDSDLCFACSQAVRSGPAYRCHDRECGNLFHRNCVDKLPRKIEKHPFHTRHLITLQPSKPRICPLCCKRDCRLVFGCEAGEGCEFYLCLDCALLDTKVSCRSHDHDLYLVMGVSCDVLCYACGKSYNKWPDGEVPNEVCRTRSCQFRCLECNFNFHFLCGPLPNKVKCEYHVDVLSLVDHSVSEGHSNEHYCDVCEEEIKDTQFRVYYCKDCKYVAHIHCVSSEIMKMIKENTMTQNMKLLAFGDDQWEDPESDNTNTNGDTMKFTTLQDIYDNLTEEEKAELANPFRFYDRAWYQQNYKLQRERNLARFDHIPSIFDNVNVIQNLLSSESQYEIHKELRNYIAEDGLQLENTFLRQQVEDIKGYKVPKTLVPILNTLLNKHGDLVVYCCENYV